MAYRDDIAALSPDHHWVFDGDSSALIGAANGTELGVSVGVAIAEDAAGSRVTDATSDQIALPTTATINNANQSLKVVAGWFMTTGIQTPPKRIYGEGTESPLFQFMYAFGNNSMFEVVDAGFNLQIFGPVLEPNRPYHLCGVFEGNGFANQAKFYVDGIEQTLAEPTTRQPNTATLTARGVGEFGDPSGASGVGGTSVLLNASVNGHLQHWAMWDGATLTQTQIRDELFEKGALPDVTITSDSQANMQLAVDALSSTVRPDAPLAIRVEAVLGGGDLALSFDNVTFDDRISIHVQYMGTDTLTITNNNGSDASIASTPNGGSVSFVNPAQLTVSPLVSGSEVRIYEAGTTSEIDGVEGSGTSFQSVITVSSVDVIIHALGYIWIKESSIDMTDGDVLLPVEQVVDRQYGNP